MYNITTLMKRLEAVTSRLEDIAAAAESSGNTALIAPDLSQVLSDTIRVPVAEPVRITHPPSDSRDIPESRPRCIEEFDVFLENSVGRYVKLSDELGGAVAEQARAVLAAFQEQRKILMIASKTAKPDTSGWEDLVLPMKEAAARVVEIQEEAGHFDSKRYHLTCVADAMPVLGWIYIDMFAFRHVEKFMGYARYFGNKITNEYKDKDPKQVEWVQAYYQVFHDLSDLIKDQFPSGINWFVEKRTIG